MKPEHIKVETCRACGSRNIMDVSIEKNFYLLNMDETVVLGYMVCQDCQFIFHSHYVGDDFLNAYYAKSPMLRRKESSEHEINQYQRQSDFLKAHLDLDKKKVLEIGAHTGGFLVHLAQKYGCEAYFVELSEEAKQVLLSQPGLKDYRSGKPELVDMIILRHVLEHIFDLDGFLTYIRSVLNPQGWIFIEIPDWSYLDAKTDPLIFEHLNQFSTYNLTLFLRRNGWQVDAVEKSICADDPATPNRVQRFLARPLNLTKIGESGIKEDVLHFYRNNFDHINRAINQHLKSLKGHQRIALYPASHQTFMALLETDLAKSNVIGMFDIDHKKHGRKVQDIEIYPATSLKDKEPDIIFLLTGGAFEHEIKKSFQSMGVRSEVLSINDLLNSTISA